MNTAADFTNLGEIYSLSFETQLSIFVGQIAEIYPAGPAPGGTRQQIRLRMPRGGLVDLHIFDQPNRIVQQYEGGFVRLSASPNAKRAIVWERAKSEKPGSRMGTVVCRKNAVVEVFTAAQAAQSGVTDVGFRIATRSSEIAPAPVAAAPQATSPAPSVPVALGPAVATSAPASGDILAILAEESRRFADCLKAARSALGPGADPEDIRATARVTYDRVYCPLGTNVESADTFTRRVA